MTTTGIVEKFLGIIKWWRPESPREAANRSLFCRYCGTALQPDEFILKSCFRCIDTPAFYRRKPRPIV